MPSLSELSVDQLIHMTSHLTSDDSYNAILELGCSRHPDAFVPLCALLTHENRLARALAAHAFWYYADQRAVPYLIRALRDRTGAVRREAATSLGQLGDLQAVEPLLRLLESTFMNARREAAHALAKLGDRRAVEPLLTLVHHPNKYLRRSVICALGEFQDARALPAFLERFTDTDACARMHAACAVGMLGMSAFDTLVEHLHARKRLIRQGAVHALGHLPTAAVLPHLLTMVQDRSKEVRQEVARTLGRIESQDALHALQHMRQNDPAEDVRTAAEEVLAYRERHGATILEADQEEERAAPVRPWKKVGPA